MNRRLDRLHDVLDEARAFLSLPRPEPDHSARTTPAPRGSPESARRLFAMSQPLPGTIAEAYLRRRGITALHGAGALRFHPRCYYRADADSPDRDLAGADRRRHRSRRHRSPARIAPGSTRPGDDKAPVDTPRRAMGHLLGNGVRFGVAARCHGGRRRHRDHAVAAMRHARPAHGRRRSRPITSPPSCSRRRCGVSISPATTIRPATRIGDPDRAGADGRDRGALAVAETGRLQRRSPPPRPCRSSGGLAGAARPGGCRPDSSARQRDAGTGR